MTSTAPADVRAEDNQAFVRELLAVSQPAYAAALELAVSTVSCEGQEIPS